MPWKNMPPDWIALALQWLSLRVDQLMMYLSLTAAVMLGTITKVASEVRDGDREKFLTSRLLLDLPSVLMMSSLSYGVVEYAEVTPGVASAIGVVMGYIGPRATYLLVEALADRIRGGGK